MSPAVPIARFTARAARRDPAVLAIGAFAPLAVMLSGPLTLFAFGGRARSVLDMGAATMALAGLLLAALSASLSIPEDREKRRIHFLLSKPVGRAEYLFGRFLGVLLVVGLAEALLALDVVAARLLARSPSGGVPTGSLAAVAWVAGGALAAAAVAVASLSAEGPGGPLLRAALVGTAVKAAGAAGIAGFGLAEGAAPRGDAAAAAAVASAAALQAASLAAFATAAAVFVPRAAFLPAAAAGFFAGNLHDFVAGAAPAGLSRMLARAALLPVPPLSRLEILSRAERVRGVPWEALGTGALEAALFTAFALALAAWRIRVMEIE